MSSASPGDGTQRWEGRPLGRPALFVIVPAVVLMLACFVALAAARTEPAKLFLDNFHWTVSYTAGALLAGLGWRRASPSDRKVRFWFFAGLSSYALGQVIWDLQVVMDYLVFPGPSDFLYLTLGPFLTLGVLRQLHASLSKARFRAALLDTATLSTAVLVLTLSFFLPRTSGIPAPKLATMIVYPMGMLASVCSMVVAIPTLRLRFGWPWVVLLVGSAANSLLWLHWNNLFISGPPANGTAYNTLFSVVAILTGFGAMGWTSDHVGNPAWERRYDGFLRILPILVVVGAAGAVMAVIATHAPSSEIRTLVLVGAAITLVLTLIRENLLLKDLDRILELEKAATESEVTFRALFESAPDAILLMDGKVFTDCNPAARELFGGRREDILGRSPSRFSPPNQPDGAPSAAKAKEIIATVLGGRPLTFEWRHLRVDGSPFDCEVRLSRVAGSSRDCIQAIIRDVTARKADERRLQESEARFSRAFQFSPTVKAILSLPDRRILEVNESFVRVLGFGRDEVIGKDPVSLGLWELSEHPEPSVDGGSRIMEVHAHSRNGRPVTLLASSVEIEVGGSPAKLLVATDITDRLHLEEQLRQAQKLEAIGLLSGGIAHDFNNILGVISGNAHVSLLDLPEGHPSRTGLDEILVATRRAANLVRQILAFARPQQHQVRRIQLAGALEEGRRLLRATLPATVDIRIQVGQPLPEIVADETQLQQVLINLATNSWHAMEGRSGTIVLSARQCRVPGPETPADTELPPGEYVLLSVADNGKGMDPETLRRIFDPFFTTKAPGEGSGLGLSVVHGIIKAHRGTISVRSRPGEGTTFEILLPAGTHAATPEPARSGPASGHGERILYLDDERPLVEVATVLLERLGYQVQGFTNPSAALEAVRVAPALWDAVITDLNMPGMNGLEFTLRLREIRPDLPVLLSSGNIDAVPPEQVKSSGLRGVIAKPHSLDELSGRIRELLTSDRHA